MLISISVLSSCSDETSEGVSKLTYHADISINGKELTIIPVGGTYTDEGAVVQEKGIDIPFQTESNVNSNVMGVYYTTYSAKNSDGFTKSKVRTVIVKSATPPTDDFTGKYKRTAGAKGIAEWTKVEDGVFFVTDIGGANIPSASAYVISTATNKFIVPEQYLGGEIGNIVTCTNSSGGEEIDFIPGAPDSFKWVVLNDGYGAATRTFLEVVN